MHQPVFWTDQTFVDAITGGGANRDTALHWWFGNVGLQQWVRRYAQQHGGSEADGEDLYHDTFITFDRLLREGKYRKESSLKTFFCSIAKWQWLNLQRKRGRMQSLEEKEVPEIGQFAEEDMYDRERQAVLQQLLEKLGTRCKRILTLYQLNYTMKEIATEMAYSSDQVAMNQCSECRKKLKALIENSAELKEFLNI